MASASANPVFKDGGNSNKHQLFSGEYFDFWKICMNAHLEAQGDEIWDDVENGLFVPTSVVNGVGMPKIKSSWNEGDKKKVLYIKKAINILQNALIMDEFFCVSKCTLAKKIWDILVETHEGTVEVKRSRIMDFSLYVPCQIATSCIISNNCFTPQGYFSTIYLPTKLFNADLVYNCKLPKAKPSKFLWFCYFFPYDIMHMLITYKITQYIFL